MNDLTFIGKSLVLLLMTVWRSVRFICLVFACPFWVTFMLVEFLLIKDPCLWEDYSRVIDVALEKESLYYLDNDFYISNIWVLGTMSIVVCAVISINA